MIKLFVHSVVNMILHL